MKSGNWRETPSYNWEEREERAKAHCKTWQRGHHIDTLARDHYESSDDHTNDGPKRGPQMKRPNAPQT